MKLCSLPAEAATIFSSGAFQGPTVCLTLQ